MSNGSLMAVGAAPQPTSRPRIPLPKSMKTNGVVRTRRTHTEPSDGSFGLPWRNSPSLTNTSPFAYPSAGTQKALLNSSPTLSNARGHPSRGRASVSPFWTSRARPSRAPAHASFMRPTHIRRESSNENLSMSLSAALGPSPLLRGENSMRFIPVTTAFLLRRLRSVLVVASPTLPSPHAPVRIEASCAPDRTISDRFISPNTQTFLKLLEDRSTWRVPVPMITGSGSAPSNNSGDGFEFGDADILFL